jgi:hypothetical protein
MDVTRRPRQHGQRRAVAAGERLLRHFGARRAGIRTRQRRDSQHPALSEVPRRPERKRSIRGWTSPPSVTPAAVKADTQTYAPSSAAVTIRARTPASSRIGTVVALADSCAGWGCLATLPDGIAGFTTSELKVNLVATTQMPDALICVSQMLHGGRSTQVWDATVTRSRNGRAIAHYRATQHLLTEQR